MKFTAVDAQKQAQYWPPADAFATAVRSCLDDVQASAGKWQTGLTAVLGLVGAVALIGGRDSLSKIGPEARVWVVALAAVALVANLVAIGLATLSNVGLPKMARIKGPEALINTDLAPLRQTRRAIDYLRWAILTAAAAFLATIAAVIVLWLAPDANPSPTTVSLTVTSGGTSVTVCGTLATDQPTDGHHVALVRSSPNETDTYPLSSISNVEPGGC